MHGWCGTEGRQRWDFKNRHTVFRFIGKRLWG
jgi:hypothetical protein